MCAYLSGDSNQQRSYQYTLGTFIYTFLIRVSRLNFHLRFDSDIHKNETQSPWIEYSVPPLLQTVISQYYCQPKWYSLVNSVFKTESILIYIL